MRFYYAKAEHSLSYLFGSVKLGVSGFGARLVVWVVMWGNNVCVDGWCRWLDDGGFWVEWICCLGWDVEVLVVADYEDLVKNDGRKLSRLERQKLKVEQEKAKLDKLMAAEKEKNRKKDTRVKILWGVVLEGAIADGELSEVRMQKWLDKYITNETDRALCREFYQQHSTWKPETKGAAKN